MKISTLISTTTLALISFNLPVSAQQPAPIQNQHSKMHEPMMNGQGMQMHRPDMRPPMRPPEFMPPNRPPRMMPDFPSPQELARMAPPEPMTEEKIKQRFAKQKEELQASLDRDRKAAEKYASDFARLQKYQADRLAEMMARAEDRRAQMLQRLEEQEKRVLEQFREQQAPEKVDTVKEET